MYYRACRGFVFVAGRGIQPSLNPIHFAVPGPLCRGVFGHMRGVALQPARSQNARMPGAVLAVAFFSGLEIPFPGNEVRSRQRLGSNGNLLRRKPEHLVLVGPFGRQIGEADR